MKLASGTAPVAAMRAAGVAVGLGTDGAASNNDLDMFEAMRQAAFLHKLRRGDPRAHAGAGRRSRWRRSTGARALGMDRTDRLARAGKRADLIVVSMAAARQTPMYDPVSHLVYVDARRRRADDDRQREGPDARPEGADAGRGGTCSPRPRRWPSKVAGGGGASDAWTSASLHAQSTIQARMRELAAEIERDYPADEEIHLVGVLKGGFMFMADLVRAMSAAGHDGFHRRLELREEHQVVRRGALLKDLDTGLEGRHVIIVEDIVDTG